MTIAITFKEPTTGRLQREDNTLINVADLMVPKLHTFHDGSVAPADGTKFQNTEGRDVLTFGIGGTSTTQVYEFRGIDDVGNDNLVTCYRSTDLSSATGTSIKGETWDAPITGLATFYVKATSLSGGTSIVKGRSKKGS